MHTRSFLPCAISAVLALAAAPALALDIMLVNDDGCNSDGIQALASVLQERGHTVSMYAPSGEQSGQGSRLTLPKGSCTVRFELSDTDLSGAPVGDSRFYCIKATAVPASDSCTAESHLPLPFLELGQTVSASPGDSAFIGLTAFGEQKPDLVISGINAGDNIGLTANYSGTVAAAMTSLRNGVPAIATSLSVRSRDFQPAANFVADLVAELERVADGGPLLPAKTGLNVNIPAGTAKGVLFTQVGTDSTIGVADQLQTDGTYIRAYDLKLAPEGVPVEQITDEATALREGYISISTIDGDYNATSAPQAFTRLKLDSLAEQP
ncbi:5'/3'-nucleotidase SurE [Halopseudomonas maritima]|uniref:5'/3'-nucleotidase SurE n=1 Tax=Halopseudomonas maritima TaxID=2918528 RepID=UPI001EEBBC22|nr:5'/3'-nucleotidase SurE [Halopseudomonas maritima]UJJ33062.1 5'/3'-nucleotidase SurE [Halopseudomonas maritima]